MVWDTSPAPGSAAGRDGVEFVGERRDAAPDVVADGTDLVDTEAFRVWQLPVDVALAGLHGQASPQPIVTTIILALGDAAAPPTVKVYQTALRAE